MDITGFKSKDGTIHRYDYNALVNRPVIPEGSGSDGDESGQLTDVQITALDNLFKIIAYTKDAADEYAAFRAAFALDDSGESGGDESGGDESGGDESGGDEPGGDTGSGDNTGSGGETSDAEWIEIYTIDDNYTTGGIVNNTTGEVDENGSWNTSDFIEVPDGATTWSRVTSRQGDHKMVWYDADKNFLSGTNDSYVGTGQYGNGYTDESGIEWNLMPMGAKYVRVSWRTSATYTSVSFKHNTTMTENVTPEYGEVYYYTVPNGYYAFGDYLRCDGMAYAQARPIKRCGTEFYDEDHSLISRIDVTTNSGNNLAVPAGAKYIRVSNGSNNEAAGASGALIAFTATEVTKW